MNPARFSALSIVALVVSASLLALEVMTVRILSYAIDPRLVYGAISVALAGLGAASVVVSVRPSLGEGDVVPKVAGWSITYSFATLLSLFVFARVSRAFSAASFGAVMTRGIPILAICALPYVPGGIALTLALSASRERIARAYAGSLVGSAIGCVVPFVFMRRYGIESVLCVAAALPSALAIVLVKDRLRALVPAVFGCVLPIGIALSGVAPRFMPFVPDPHDLLGIATATYVFTHPGTPLTFSPKRDYAAWDPVSRVEVFTFPGDFGRLNDRVPIKLVTQDGGAGTILVGFGQDEEALKAWADQSVYGAGYLVKPHPERVLIVGLGGGVDAVTALHHGAKNVTGVEINASILDASTRVFDAFQNHALTRPGVTVLHGDGRSLLERAQLRGEKWPFIQMSGADTYSAGAGGAFVFSESYLYTVDAFEKYVKLLDDDGVLGLIRFGPEPLRAVVSEAVALKNLGIQDARRHFFIVRQGICQGIVLSKRSLSDDDVKALMQRFAATLEMPRIRLPMWDAMGFGFADHPSLEYAPGVTPTSTYESALLAVEASDAALDTYLDTVPFDASPTSDDRPFFFQLLKPADFGRLPSLEATNFFAAGLLGHARLVLGFLLVAAITLLVPPLAFRKADAPRPPAWTTLYFALLGLAFMLVELDIIQRTVLLLGHPTLSVSVTLGALLVGSGIGSSFVGAPRLGKNAATWAAFAIVIAVVVGDRVAPKMVELLLPLPLLLRAVIQALTIASLGIAMGIPFPSGLRAAEKSGGAAWVGWALAVNGFAGVLGSLVAVPVAMMAGFSAVAIGAAVLYGLAGLVARGRT